MTEIENEFGESQRTEEARDYRKTSTSMLKEFAHVKLQKSESENLPVEIIAADPGVLQLTKACLVTSEDVEQADWALMYQLRKAGTPIPKLNDISRTSIGSVTGGQVPRKKLPSEVEEGLTNMENYVNRLSPGQPESQVDTRKPFSPISSNRTGYINQNLPVGNNPDIPKGPETYTPSGLGRGVTPRATNLRDNRNPGFGLNSQARGVSDPRRQTYGEYGKLQYTGISQKPGDARTTYRSFSPTYNKSGVINVTPGSGEMLKPGDLPKDTDTMLVKGRYLHDPEEVSSTTQLIKDMAGVLMKADPDNIAPITKDAVTALRNEEDEARRAEVIPATETHKLEELRLDDEDELEATKYEALADEIEKRARQPGLNELVRTQALETAKTYRAMAGNYMKQIRARHGNINEYGGM